LKACADYEKGDETGENWKDARELTKSAGRQVGGGPRTRRQTWFRVPRANSLLTGCKMNNGSDHSSNSLAFAWYGLCILRTCSPICPNMPCDRTTVGATVQTCVHDLAIAGCHHNDAREMQ
jgi:hypothetical protein